MGRYGGGLLERGTPKQCLRLGKARGANVRHFVVLWGYTDSTVRTVFSTAERRRTKGARRAAEHREAKQDFRNKDRQGKMASDREGHPDLFEGDGKEIKTIATPTGSKKRGAANRAGETSDNCASPRGHTKAQCHGLSYMNKAIER